MSIRDSKFKIIGEAVVAIKPYITEDEFKTILRKHDIAKSVGQELDLDNTNELDSFELTVLDIAENHNLRHIIDPIYKQLEDLYE